MCRCSAGMFYALVRRNYSQVRHGHVCQVCWCASSREDFQSFVALDSFRSCLVQHSQHIATQQNQDLGKRDPLHARGHPSPPWVFSPVPWVRICGACDHGKATPCIEGLFGARRMVQRLAMWRGGVWRSGREAKTRMHGNKRRYRILRESSLGYDFKPSMV